MRVGVPKEIKVHEYRVGLTPTSVAELVAAGHEVVVETNAGTGIDFDDSAYVRAGARIAPDADAVFAEADMIVKVKEPLAVEIARLQPRHTLFTYLHLAPDPEQAKGLLKSGATCIAYETVTSRTGQLPLLKPMSEVAGRMSIQVAAHYLEKEQGGRGGPGEGDVAVGRNAAREDAEDFARSAALRLGDGGGGARGGTRRHQRAGRERRRDRA